MNILVKVKTNAKKNEILKISDNYFEIKTTSVPESGKANQSVIEILSKFFRTGKTKIKIVKGQKSHLKTVEINFD